MARYRTRKGSGAKGVDQGVVRNSQGVAIKPEKYKWGKAKLGTDLTGYHRLSLEEVDFLEKYAQFNADLKQIGAATGLTPKQCSKMLEKESVRAEILEIQKVWRNNRKMTAEHAASFHIDLLNQLKQDYNAIESPTDRAKMANPLVKASETYLKAAGHFNHGSGESEAQITINIDLGDGGEIEVDRTGRKAKVKKDG